MGISGGFQPVELFFKEELECKSIDKALSSTNHLLPYLGSLWDSCHVPFAQVLIGYNALGIYVSVTVETPKITVSYPEIEKGDAIQLFIDTRAVIHAKTTHRFCHHFFFLPEAFEGITQGEITRFRTEDSHPLCESTDLECSITKTKKGYSANLFLPRECLVGYAPEECNKIGFTYRISRSDGAMQYFSLGESVGQVEYAPYLWTGLRLV